MIAFAMGNLTAMCANNYDMPLFGVDEWFWQKEHSIRKVGALVDTTTLTDYLQEFIPGSDQPGDWSARQTQLFNGRTYESGNIQGTLGEQHSPNQEPNRDRQPQQLAEATRRHRTQPAQQETRRIIQGSGWRNSVLKKLRTLSGLRYPVRSSSVQSKFSPRSLVPKPVL